MSSQISYTISSATNATERSILTRPVGDSFSRMVFAWAVFVGVVGACAFAIYSVPGGRIPFLVGAIIYGIGLGVAHLVAMLGADALDLQRWRRFRNGGMLGALVGFAAAVYLDPNTYVIGDATPPLATLILLRVGLPAAAGALVGYVNMIVHDASDKEGIVAALRHPQTTN